MCSGVPTWLNGNANAIKSPGYRATSRANEMNFFPQCLSLLISAKVNSWCSCVVYIADMLGKNVSVGVTMATSTNSMEVIWFVCSNMDLEILPVNSRFQTSYQLAA